MSDERVSATRRIAASASDIFGIVTDPAKHVEIDGSHMLEAVENATPLRAVGDSFIVNMDRDALGDARSNRHAVDPMTN